MPRAGPPIGELSLTWTWSLCSFDVHHKVKERALDPGLPLRQMKCSDSSMVPGGKVEGQARGNASGVLGSVCWDPGCGPSDRL